MKNTYLFFQDTLVALRKVMLVMLSVVTLTQCQTQASEITPAPTGGLALEADSEENNSPTIFPETHVADATSHASDGLFRVPITDCSGRAVAILYCDKAGTLTACSTQGKPLRINNAPLPPVLSQNALQVKGNLQQWYARVHNHGLEIVPRLRGGGSGSDDIRELERRRYRLEQERDRIRRENEERERRIREENNRAWEAECRRQAAEAARLAAEREKAEAEARAQKAEKDKQEEQRKIREFNKRIEDAKAAEAKAIEEKKAVVA